MCRLHGRSLRVAFWMYSLQSRLPFALSKPARAGLKSERSIPKWPLRRRLGDPRFVAPFWTAAFSMLTGIGLYELRR